MHHQDSPSAIPPVLDCVFPDGHDTVLVNPAITTRQWQRKQFLGLVRPMTILKGLVCTGVAVLVSGAGHGFGEKLVLVAVTLILVLGGWRVLSRPIADGRPPYEGVLQPRLRRGEFLRGSDFADLGAASAGLVNELLAGIEDLHRSPARAWIDPALPGEIHRVVWQALCCLDRSRDTRALIDELASHPDAGDDLTAATRRAVEEIDANLREVARHVRGCLVLVRAWEEKIRRQDLTVRTSRALAALPGKDHIRGLSQDAEALTQNVFAHVTAARDVTQAGKFPWERPPSAWPRLVLLLSCQPSNSASIEGRS